MKKFAAIAVLLMAATIIASAQSNAPTVETIVAVRHGEKPKGGLGQLNAQGLNRALALPKVLMGKFGQPDFIFAPNPTQKVDSGSLYYYIRPLMTIEPTAIRCGLPVNTQFGYKEIGGLARELAKTNYQSATVFLAWEHGLLDDFAKDLVKKYGGDTNIVPPWPSKDFDSIFVFKVTRDAGKNSIAFSIDHENLNNLSTRFPGD